MIKEVANCTPVFSSNMDKKASIEHTCRNQQVYE